MDTLVAAAGRAIAAGDVCGALEHVALRADAPALALRGIAMVQLGEHVRARGVLRRAARGFGDHEARLRARCMVAAVEVTLAMRDRQAAPPALGVATAILDAHVDRAHASAPG